MAQTYENSNILTYKIIYPKKKKKKSPGFVITIRHILFTNLEYLYQTL